MPTGKEVPFPSPEANIFGALLKIEPTQFEPKVEAQRQKAVSATLGLLSEQHQFILWELVGQGRKLTDVTQELATRYNRSIFKWWTQQQKDRTLERLRSSPDIDNLAVFLPYEANHLGRVLWGVDYGYQLLTLLAPVDIRRLRLVNLPLPQTTTQEIAKQMLHRNNHQKMRIVPFLRRFADGYSEAARADIKQSFVSLQKRAKR